MEEKDLSQNPELEPQAQEQQPQQESKPAQTKKEKLVNAVVKDFLEFRKFDLIHKIYYLLLSREALTKLAVHLTLSKDYKTEFKPFIDNYTKSTYILIRNYLHKENVAKINEDIDNLAKTFMTSGRLASDLYFKDILFSQRGFEMLRLYLTTTFVLPLIKKADSKVLYNDLKTIHVNSKDRSITTDFNTKQVAIINNLIGSSLDLSYSAFALKKSMITFSDFNRIELDLDYETLATEQARTIPYNEDYDGDKDEEKMNRVYIKVDKDYKTYYQTKIHELVEQFVKNDLTAGNAKYFHVTAEIYLSYATHLMKHDNAEVGTFIALTLANECSRGFKENLKPEDFAAVKNLKNICSTIINNSLIILYSVGNIIDHHELKGVLSQFEEAFAVPGEHYMGATDLTVYFKAWYTLVKFGKEGLDNFFHRNSTDKQE